MAKAFHAQTGLGFTILTIALILFWGSATTQAEFSSSGLFEFSPDHEQYDVWLKEVGIDLAELDIVPLERDKTIVDLHLQKATEEGTFTLSENLVWTLWTIEFMAQPHEWVFSITFPDGHIEAIQENEFTIKDMPAGTYKWNFSARLSDLEAWIEVRVASIGWAEGTILVLPEDRYTAEGKKMLLNQVTRGNDLVVVSNNAIANEYGVFFDDTRIQKALIMKNEQGKSQTIVQAGQKIEVITLNKAATSCLYFSDFEIPEGSLFETFYCRNEEGQTYHLFFLSEVLFNGPIEKRQEILSIVSSHIQEYRSETSASEKADFFSEEFSSKYTQKSYPLTTFFFLGLAWLVFGGIALWGIRLFFKMLGSYGKTLIRKSAKWVKEKAKRLKLFFRRTFDTIKLNSILISKRDKPYFLYGFISLLVIGGGTKSVFHLYKSLTKNSEKEIQLMLGIILAIGLLTAMVRIFKNRRELLTRWKEWNKNHTQRAEVLLWSGVVGCSILFMVTFLYELPLILRDIFLLFTLTGGMLLLVIPPQLGKDQMQSLVRLIRILPLFLILPFVLINMLQYSFSLETEIDIVKGETVISTGTIQVTGLKGKSLNDVSELVQMDRVMSRLFYDEGFEIIIPMDSFKSEESKPINVMIRSEIQASQQVDIEIEGVTARSGQFFYSPLFEKFNRVKIMEDKITGLYQRYDQKPLQAPDYKIPNGSYIGLQTITSDIFYNPLRSDLSSSGKTVWKTKLQMSDILEGYLVAQANLKFSIELKNIDPKKIPQTPWVLTLRDSQGASYTRNAKGQPGGKLNDWIIEWEMNDLNPGVYEWKIGNANTDRVYDIQALSATTQKLVLKDPLNVQAGATVFFKQWSQEIKYANEQGLPFKGEIISIEGARAESLEEILIDEERLWSITFADTGSLEDSFQNLYAFSKESWFNPWEYTITEGVTAQTQYMFLENNVQILSQDDTGMTTLELHINGTWTPNATLIIRCKFHQKSPENWINIKTLGIQINIGKTPFLF